VLTWVAIGSAVGAVLLAGGWVLRRTDALGRPRTFPVWSVALLGLLAVTATVPVVRTARLEHRLGAVASTLVGSPVTVDCQSRGQEMTDLGHELGWVPYDAAGRPQPRTLIKRRPCSALRDYLGSDKDSPSREQVVAVHVLGHEARHMAGQTVEAEAECAAVQRDALTARLLGATPEQASSLARAYWLEVYPQLPDSYWTAECAPGMGLDERLPDAPWAG
jgi:hypothetical protein